MKVTTLRDIKQGEYFRKINKDGEEFGSIWIRGEYCQAGRYQITNTTDIWGNGSWMNGDKLVKSGFTY